MYQLALRISTDFWFTVSRYIRGRRVVCYFIQRDWSYWSLSLGLRTCYSQKLGSKHHIKSGVRKAERVQDEREVLNLHRQIWLRLQLCAQGFEEGRIFCGGGVLWKCSFLARTLSLSMGRLTCLGSILLGLWIYARYLPFHLWCVNDILPVHTSNCILFIWRWLVSVHASV